MRRILCFFLAVALLGCMDQGPFTLQPTDNPVPPLPAGTYEVGGVTTPPVATRTVATVYPYDLRSRGIDGHAVIVLTITSDGSIADMMVQKATDIRFGDAATAALAQWSFRPARIGNAPVNCRMVVPIDFHLGGP